MMHKFKFLTRDNESSNIWIIIVSLLIFHFIYYYLIIHTNVVMDCMPYEEFWTWTDESGVGLFKIFIFIFTLFGIWAFLEMVIARKRDLKDKTFCTISTFFILIYVIYLMMSFKAHWESFEVKWGKRDYQDISFTFGYIPPNHIKTPWDKFINDKECTNPHYYRNLKTPEDHQKYWNNMLFEFYENGGTLEEINQSNQKIIGSKEAYELYRKQGIKVIVTKDNE